MRRTLSTVLFLFVIACLAVAQTKPPAKAPAKSTMATAANTPATSPQLIDRELFFGNPEIGAAQISPNGKYITFMKPWKDTRNIWVKGVDEPFSAARLLTTETKRPIAGYFWTYDSK